MAKEVTRCGRRRSAWAVLLVSSLVVLLLAQRASAIFLPGIVPDDFDDGAPLEIVASKMISDRSKVPFDYYTLPLCHSNGTHAQPKVLNLGRIFLGEQTRFIGYQVNMRRNVSCMRHCEANFASRFVKRLARRIHDEYKVRLNLDNLPVVTREGGRADGTGSITRLGYPLGYEAEGRTFVYNHLRFKIRHHRVQLQDFLPSSVEIDGVAPVYRVVGFEVTPMSVQHPPSTRAPPLCGTDLESAPPLELSSDGAMNITFTYDVEFVESEQSWVTRWDALTQAQPGHQQIQWFAIVNSFLLCLFLSTLIMLILLRTLRKDLFSSDLVGSDLDESGWKSLRRDVFRPPRNNTLLCILCGSGVQLFLITTATLALCLVGFVSPTYRSRLLTASLVIWVLTSSVAGYSAARLHKIIDGTRLRDVALGTASVVPGLVFAVAFGINVLFWLTGSIGGTSVLSFVLLLLMWFCVSMPLCYIGAQLGARVKASDPTARYSSISREIPELSFAFGTPMVLAGGGLPFGVLSAELLFILNSLWQSDISYMFGFLFFVYLIVLVVSSETSAVITYAKLINENHRWWWPAFFSTASTGAYVFLYSIYYLVTHQNLDGMNFLSDTVILGYMAVLSMLLSVMLGTVGFLASLWFVMVIYSAVRAD